MKLYIGGMSQGKTEYVKGTEGLSAGAKSLNILDDFHLWVRERVFAGLDEKEILRQLDEIISKNPDIIIISNEIGNGIVPMDPIERRYRDITGHLLIEVAGKSTEVFRIMCGTATRLK